MFHQKIKTDLGRRTELHFNASFPMKMCAEMRPSLNGQVLASETHCFGESVKLVKRGV